LVDSQGAIERAMRHAFAACDLPPPAAAQVAAIIGLSLPAALRRLGVPESLLGQVERAYRAAYLREEQALRLFPGVVPMLDALRAHGYWLGIVTGKSRAGLLRVLDAFALRDHFLVWRTADCCPSKPHPAMVYECMDELGVAAEETVLIGDAAFDMQMAVAAGVRPYGVSFGVAQAEQLRRHGALHVFDSADEILANWISPAA